MLFFAYNVRHNVSISNFEQKNFKVWIVSKIESRPRSSYVLFTCKFFFATQKAHPKTRI